MLQNRLYYSQSKMFSLSKKMQEDEALCRSIGWTYGRAIPYFHFGVRVDIMATQTKTRATPFSYCKCVTRACLFGLAVAGCGWLCCCAGKAAVQEKPLL
jgi:hypothetical protein